MDWGNFLSALAGGAIALIGNRLGNRNQNRIFEKQIKEQNNSFEKQIVQKKKEENEFLLKRKKEVATILYYLIPEIAWEGFQLKKKALDYPTTIFSNFDYISGLNILRDELGKEEILYLTKLFANLEAIKMVPPYSGEFENGYSNFLSGFCNGYINCGEYYYQNIHNSKNANRLPFEKIIETKAENITKDYIMGCCNSDFINTRHNDIYSKLEMIKDYGTSQ